MKALKLLGFLCVGLCLTALMPRSAQADPPNGWGYNLVWHDEFNGNSLNATNWNLFYPWNTTSNAGLENPGAVMGPIYVYNSGAFIVPNQPHVAVAGGQAVITATYNNGLATASTPTKIHSNQFNKDQTLYTQTGAFNSVGKQAWAYGYFEAMIQFPGQGNLPPVSTWPAFSMVSGTAPREFSLNSVVVPSIDVASLSGSRTLDQFGLHYVDQNGNLQELGGTFVLPTLLPPNPNVPGNAVDLSAGYHLYGFEWTPTDLIYYVDNIEVGSFNSVNLINQLPTTMAFLFDLQQGGLASDPPTAAPFEQATNQMRIKYVRTFQINSNTGAQLGPADGVYQIIPQNATDKVLDAQDPNGSPQSLADIFAPNLSVQQQWTIEAQGDGTYKIRSAVGFDECLTNLNSADILGGSSATGSVGLYPDIDSDDQKWYFQDTANGGQVYRLIPKSLIDSDVCLEVTGAGAVDGALLDTGAQSNGSNQLFTLSTNAIPAPQITNVIASPVTQTTATISWTTDLPGDSSVSYGTDINYGQFVSDSTQTTAHTLLISGLTPSTTYHFQVTSTDALGQPTSSGDFTFTTGLGVAPSPLGVTVNPTSVLGGGIVTGTVTLTAPATPGGVLVYLTNNMPSVLAATAVLVPEGKTTANFTDRSLSVPYPVTILITAKYGVTSATTTLTITAPTVIGFTVNPNTTAGGYNPTGTVTLSGPAPHNGLYVSLTSSNRTVAPINSTVFVAAGQTSVQFPISTNAVTTPQNVMLTAALGTSKVNVTLAVVPLGIAAFVVTPNPVQGGVNPTGTVYLTSAAPAGGTKVLLYSSNRAVAPIDSQVIVPAGAYSATFSIGTHPVPVTQSVVLTAAYGGTSSASTLTVKH